MPLSLWYRRDNRSRWERVARAASYGEGVRLIGLGDRRHGDWWIGPPGEHPADKRPATDRELFAGLAARRAGRVPVTV